MQRQRLPRLHRSARVQTCPVRSKELKRPWRLVVSCSKGAPKRHSCMAKGKAAFCRNVLDM
jgi:hypothetical protein